MARPDLIAISDDGLIQLANAGLVKRGLRDLAEGNAPALEEAADGTVEARFADGTVTRLVVGRPPGDATCSCPSSGMCRHRIGLVLTYRHANRALQPAAAELWDPGTLDFAALETALPASARAELARVRAAPLQVRLSRGATPSAALPMATVRFLAPNDPGYARCDCVAGQGCLHIVLAVEAFRAATGAAEVTLGTAAVATPVENLRLASDVVLARLLTEGATAGLAAHGALIDQARSIAEGHGATWQVLALEALAAQIGAYDQRSALYDEAEVLNLATEIFARPRASSAGLGLGEAMETAMAKTRLVSLGARLLVRGRDLLASVALFDTDTGTTVLIEKDFAPAGPDERLTPDAVLVRPMVPGLPLKGLARGQVLTSVAHRRADGTVRFGSGVRGKTTLMPRGVLAEPPVPLLVTALATVRAEFATRPPAFLQPRNRVADVRVFAIESVVGQAFEPGAQVWRAAVTLLNDGGQLHLQRRYDAAAPGAIDALTAAFSGAHGRVQQIAGRVWVEGGEVVCDPWSVTADTFIVPDCDGGATTSTSQSSVSFATDAVQGAQAVRQFLAAALHAGVGRRDSQFLRRGRSLVRDTLAIGLNATGERFTRWLDAPSDVVAFGPCAVWLAVLLEADASQQN
jgi:hypothetical protein